jgi:hypothetical protein
MVVGWQFAGARQIAVVSSARGRPRKRENFVSTSNHHFTRIAIAAAAAITLLPIAAASAAQANGIKILPRVTNGNPTSTLTITNSNSNPGTVTIDDRGFTQAGTNRHDALVSVDNGATAGTFPIGQPFTISADFTLTDGFNSPRKEAGFEINGSPTGRSLFIINSDAGEIVAFGGGAPFKSFGNNAGGNGYTPGQTITLGMIYRPGLIGGGGTASPPGSLEYFIDRTPLDGQATGYSTSGPLTYSNLEGGPTNFTFGAYAQFNTNAANFATDFGNVALSNFTVNLPEPASLASLAVGGLLLRRRR